MLKTLTSNIRLTAVRVKYLWKLLLMIIKYKFNLTQILNFLEQERNLEIT